MWPLPESNHDIERDHIIHGLMPAPHMQAVSETVRGHDSGTENQRDGEIRGEGGTKRRSGRPQQLRLFASSKNEQNREVRVAQTHLSRFGFRDENLEENVTYATLQFRPPINLNLLHEAGSPNLPQSAAIFWCDNSFFLSLLYTFS